MRPIFFLHIPKTAGTSVNDFLAGLSDVPSAQHIEMHRLWHSPDYWRKYPFVSGHINFYEARKFAPSSFLFVTFLREPWQELLSVIRYQYAVCAKVTRHQFDYVGPLLRKFSERMQDVNLEDPKEFELWLLNTLAADEIGNIMLDNFQTRFLARVAANQRVADADLHVAMQNLRSIPAVGIVEKMDESMRLICDVAGIDVALGTTVKSLNKKLVELEGLDKPEIREICAPLIKFDQDLYKFGLCDVAPTFIQLQLESGGCLHHARL